MALLGCCCDCECEDEQDEHSHQRGTRQRREPRRAAQAGTPSMPPVKRPALLDEPLIVSPPSFDTPQRPSFHGGTWWPTLSPVPGTPAAMPEFRFAFQTLESPDPPSAPDSPLPWEFQLINAEAVPVHGGEGVAPGRQVRMVPGDHIHVKERVQETEQVDTIDTTHEGTPLMPGYIPAYTDILSTSWRWFDVVEVVTEPYEQVIGALGVGEGYGVQLRLRLAGEPDVRVLDNGRWVIRDTTTSVTGDTTQEVTPIGDWGVVRQATLKRYAVEMLQGGAVTDAALWAIYVPSSIGAGGAINPAYYQILASFPPGPDAEGLPEGHTRWALIYQWVDGTTDWRLLTQEERHSAVWMDAQIVTLPPPDAPALAGLWAWEDQSGAVKASSTGEGITVTAWGQTVTCHSWATLRDVPVQREDGSWDDSPLIVLTEQDEVVTALRESGAETCSRAQFITDALRLTLPTDPDSPMPFPGFSPVGLGSHSWPPVWAWAHGSTGEASAVVAWEPWRDTTKKEWPGRPRKRPATPSTSFPPDLRPPLGLTLATPAPTPQHEELLLKDQAPFHLPATLSVNGESASVNKLAKRLQFRPALWPEELKDTQGVKGTLNLTWAGPPMPRNVNPTTDPPPPPDRCAYLFRAKVKKGQLPAVQIGGKNVTVLPQGRNVGQAGWQPFLIVTDDPYPPSETTFTTDVPVSRLLLTRVLTFPGADDNGGGEGNT